MLEDENTIQKLLLTGEQLVFADFYINAIPTFNTSILISQEVSVYRVEHQEYEFLVSTKDCIDYEIKEGLEFTLSDRSYDYNFKISKDPISMLDGWSRLPADLISRSEI